jgi:hypothetical protein
MYITITSVKKNILILCLKILATVLLFYYVNKTVNFSEMYNIRLFQTGSIGLIFFIALTFGFLQQFLLFCRWYFSVKALNISCSIKSVLKSYFIGQFLGTVSPARSGDLAKVLYLENTPKRQGFNAIILDGTIAMTTLFIVGLWKNYPRNSGNSVLIIDKILSVLGIVAIIVVVISAIIIIFMRRIKSSKTLVKNLAKIFSISLLQNIVLIIQGAFIFSILLPLSFVQASFAIATSYCVMPFIPIAIAAIGIREFSFFLFISAYISEQSIKPIVFAVSYVLLLCNSVIFIIPGIVLFYRNGKKM